MVLFVILRRLILMLLANSFNSDKNLTVLNLSELNRKPPPGNFIGSDNFPIINFPVQGLPLLRQEGLAQSWAQRSLHYPPTSCCTSPVTAMTLTLTPCIVHVAFPSNPTSFVNRQVAAWIESQQCQQAPGKRKHSSAPIASVALAGISHTSQRSLQLNFL